MTKRPKIDEKSIKNFLKKIPTGDKYSLLLKVDNNIPVILNRSKNIKDFCRKYEDALQYYEIGENIRFTFNITKYRETSIRYIYNYEKFVDFWGNISSLNLLNVLTKIIVKKNKIDFIFLEDDIESFNTRFITFGYEQIKSIEDNTIKRIEEVCHFGNLEEYPITPDHFFVLNRSSANNSITEKMDILTALFSMISIYNITSIKSERFYYKIIGFKSIHGNIKIDTNFKQSVNIYYKIYKWIYSSDGNVTDKIGIARNLITIYIDKNVLKLNENILVSLQSAFNTYLKENVERYISIRNKIHDELGWVSQKSSEIIKDYLNNFQRSILTFLSFFISVFVLRVLSTGNFTNVFSKDATILSFAFLCISLIFMLFSIWSLQNEKSRLSRKYQNIKDRYKDILVEDDIKKILSDDEEFTYEITYIKKKLFYFTILWIISILILLSAVFTLSSFFNWKKLFNLFLQ